MPQPSLSKYHFYTLLFSSQFLTILAMAPINVALMESVAFEFRGTAIGLATFIMHILGDVPSTILYGRVADVVACSKVECPADDPNICSIKNETVGLDKKYMAPCSE